MNKYSLIITLTRGGSDMILEKEQINRYLRHIIIPDISGAGQKKLLDSSVLVCCDSLQNASFMLYYLTAMGIGKLTCMTDDIVNSQHLVNNLNKLNPDVSFLIVDKVCVKSIYDTVIILNELSNKEISYISAKDMPVIVAASSDGKGLIRTITKQTSLDFSLAELAEFYVNNQNNINTALLNYPCASLVSTIAAIEAVKVILGIGSYCEKPLYINLWYYSFSNDIYDIPQRSGSYDNQKLLRKLKESKVLIVGCGGLGSPVAYTLAQMGIGKLGLVDFDTVDISNLNRQILHSTDKIGMLKVESAEAFIRELNPDVDIHTYNQKFSVENAESLIKDYDIIVDGLDNLPTRYLLNDICYFLKKPLIEAGVLGFNGLTTAIIPDIGPCYRCTFPKTLDDSSIPSCSETGVLGAVPGIMGTLQAVEVIKQLTGIGCTLLNKILMFDALNMDFTLLDIYKEESCVLCGINPTIDILKD